MIIGIPKETKSIAIIVDDPDAPTGTWVHWIVFNIKPDVYTLPEAALLTHNGAVVGINDWGKNMYGGPCPPQGIHRYYFKVYALNQTLVLQKEANKNDLITAMEGKILA